MSLYVLGLSLFVTFCHFLSLCRLWCFWFGGGSALQTSLYWRPWAKAMPPSSSGGSALFYILHSHAIPRRQESESPRGGITTGERIPTRRHHGRRSYAKADPSGAHCVYSASDFGMWPVRRELQLLNHPTTSVVVHRCLRASIIVSEASGWALLQRNASSILAATCRRTCAFPSRTSAQLVSAAAIRASTVTSIETRHSSRPRRPASLST